MAGIYVHVPFCKSRCLYCDFFSTTRLPQRDAFVRALLTEIRLRATSPFAPSYATVYFGGGTPSLLSAEQLLQLTDALRRYYPIEPDAEWTIEANPDDLSPQFCRDLIHAGFNRLSIGTQSFCDKELQFVHRRHNAEQAQNAFCNAREAGFTNISLDLIYALPLQTDSSWRQSVDKTIRLRPEHISAYALTYEPGSPLTRLCRRGKIEKLPEEAELNAYQYITDALKQAGYRHYEVSNFALPGYQSRHNSAYWRRIPYLGFGPSACTFHPHYPSPEQKRSDTALPSYQLSPESTLQSAVDTPSDYAQIRWQNAPDLDLYLSEIDAGRLPVATCETLSPQEVYEEKVMLGLRTDEGIPLTSLNRDETDRLLAAAEPYVQNGLLRLSEQKLVASDRGLLLIDRIIPNLF